MRLYIDSAEMADIEAALASGYVYGVTTNPTLLRRANVRASDVPGLIRRAFELGAREIHAQTYSDEAAGMVEEGRALAALDPGRVVVKIPATEQGYRAAAQLLAEGHRVTLTAVYTVRQAVLAHAVGAHFVAVYLGRMRDAGMDALDVVGRMQRTLQACASSGSSPVRAVQILAASVRQPEEVELLAELGVATATMPWKVLGTLPEAPDTAKAAATFSEDSKALQ